MKLTKRRLIRMFFLDLIYPNRCPCCNEFIEWDKMICEKCKGNIKFTEKNMPDEKIISVCYYESEAKEGILSLKRGDSENFACFSADRIAEKFKELNFNDANEYIVISVPMAKRKKRIKGFNHAELIAKEVSKNLGLKYKKNILTKKYSKVSQHMLSQKERILNKGQYKIKNVNLKGMKFILCDDVITTGSTINECAGLLKKNGAENVIAACAAKTVFSD